VPVVVVRLHNTGFTYFAADTCGSSGATEWAALLAGDDASVEQACRSEFWTLAHYAHLCCGPGGMPVCERFTRTSSQICLDEDAFGPETPWHQVFRTEWCHVECGAVHANKMRPQPIQANPSRPMVAFDSCCMGRDHFNTVANSIASFPPPRSPLRSPLWQECSKEFASAAARDEACKGEYRRAFDTDRDGRDDLFVCLSYDTESEEECEKLFPGVPRSGVYRAFICRHWHTCQLTSSVLC